MTINLMMMKFMKIILKNHVDMCELMTSDDTSPNVEKKEDHNQP